MQFRPALPFLARYNMDRVCAPIIVRGTEFAVLYDPITKTTERRFGTCGPRAIASALSSALGRVVSLQEVYTWMRSHNDSSGNPYCDESGASTLSGGVVCCEAFGAVVVDSLGFSDTLPFSEFQDFVRRHAGIDPCVWETSVGQSLVDSISGDGENATNLEFHFPAILVYHDGGVSDYFGGKVLAEGVGAADGDNFAGGNSNANGFNAANVLQFYTMTVLEACKPVGIYALKGRNVALQIAQTNGLFKANTDGSWESSHGVRLGGGFLTEYQNMAGVGNLNGLSDLGLPLTGELTVSGIKPGHSGFAPVIQIFERGALIADPDKVVDNPPGAGTIYKAHLTRPEVLKVFSPPAPAPAPTPVPVLNFGTPTVESSESNGEVILTITQPFTQK